MTLADLILELFGVSRVQCLSCVSSAFSKLNSSNLNSSSSSCHSSPVQSKSYARILWSISCFIVLSFHTFPTLPFLLLLLVLITHWSNFNFLLIFSPHIFFALVKKRSGTIEYIFLLFADSY